MSLVPQRKTLSRRFEIRPRQFALELEKAEVAAAASIAADQRKAIYALAVITDTKLTTRRFWLTRVSSPADRINM